MSSRRGTMFHFEIIRQCRAIVFQGVRGSRACAAVRVSSPRLVDRWIAVSDGAGAGPDTVGSSSVPWQPVRDAARAMATTAARSFRVVARMPF